MLLLVCVTGAAQLWRPTPDPPLGPGAAHLLLDPNNATRSELMLLPNIGPRLSARIVAYRRTALAPPAFSTADDLANVRGIGPATVETLRPFLRFGPRTPTTHPGAP